MSADVFISYAAKDRERVAKLVDGLQKAGVSVWIDMAGIEVASMWSKEIVSAIRDCKVLLISISPQSTESENVVKELALASERKKPIIPIYLEPAEIPETMEYQLAGIQRVEFYEGREEKALQAVIRALAKLKVAVADEASIAAADASSITAHGHGHSSAGQSTNRGGAHWGKIAAVTLGLTALAAGMFFLGGSNNASLLEKSALGQVKTNNIEKTQPLANSVTLDTNRVVVLPFKTIGSSEETSDMGYGLVSTLTSKLQPLQNLTVIANESALQFEASKLPPKKIGQALQVGTIVTGEIQTSGDKIQVNIRVIDANTAALGWGSTFTKMKDEFLDLQNEIATQLASELKGGLADAESQQIATKATANPKAQLEYQAGRREWNMRSKEGFDNAIKHFERAIELDPGYADPYVGLGDTYGLLPVYNFAEPSDAMPKAKTYAKKAIELNPNLASAYNSIAWVFHAYEYDWADAEANYRKAIKLNPNYATAHHWFGEFLYNMGKPEEGYTHLLKASELAPTSKIILCNFAFCCWLIDKNEEALENVEKALEIDPFFHFSLNIKHYRLKKGNIEKAISTAEKARKKYPKQPSYLRLLFNLNWINGNREKALLYFIEILDKHHDSYQKNEIAGFYFLLNQSDDAYRWLQKAMEDRETLVPLTGVDPSFKKFQSEPRFQEMYKKINHPVYLEK